MSSCSAVHDHDGSLSIPQNHLPLFSTHPHTIRRPVPFLHPTHALFSSPSPSAEGSRIVDYPAHWSSRASRKNRFAARPLRVVHSDPRMKNADSPERELVEKDPVTIEQRLHHPHARFKLHLTWDISFWVAVTFILGSTFWVINGFILFLPLAPSHSSPHGNAAAWIAFAGGTFFEIGSYLMYLEAINAGHEKLFGPALWGLIEDAGADWTGSKDSERSVHDRGASRTHVDFRWLGRAPWRELGFLASVAQLCAASIFWISTITGVPGVIPNLSTNPPVAITYVFYWTPQLLGGTGFIISSLLLMIEVQRTWWRPNLRSLGWHIGFWNLIGAVGFMLCGALGYASVTSTKANYQSVLATFWGSWAFLIGSTVQLWETLWREDTNHGD